MVKLVLKLLRSPLTLTRMLMTRIMWPRLLRLQGVEHGPGLGLIGRPRIEVSEGGTIRLGRQVKLLSRRNANPLHLRAPCTLLLAAPGARITIGDDCSLSGVVVYAAAAIDIGNRVLLGANAILIDSDGHPLSPESRQAHRTRGSISQPIVIGNDVFVGAHAMILRGTELGDGCVVGASAVVKGVFPPRSVIVGNPARVVKTLEPQDHVIMEDDAQEKIETVTP